MHHMNGGIKKEDSPPAMPPPNNCNQKFRVGQTTRVSIIVSIPIIFLIGITANVLTISIEAYDVSAVASMAMSRAIDLSLLANKLQIERGTTSMFLSSNRSSLQAFAGLMEARAKSELHVFKLGNMPPLLVGNVTVKTKEEFVRYISMHRQSVDNSDPVMTQEANMQFYADINDAILEHIAKSISAPSHDRWLIAFNSLFLAKDIADVKRAIGAAYFIQCSFSTAHRRWFSRLEVEFETYLQFTFYYHPKSKERYSELMVSNLQMDLSIFNDWLQDDTYIVECQRESLNTRQFLSQHWFDNMTLYISQLSYVMNKLAKDLKLSLDGVHVTAKTEMIIYSTVLVFVLVSSGCTVYLIYGMVSHMQNTELNLSEKTMELEGEQKRTEDLLNHMLPTTVAYRLKHSQAVPAEYYDMVTIYFSEIVGFTRISALLSPHQVIDMLNGLNIMLDMVIDKYDAYKVETIGGAYMVASGIPERNGNEHARQIAQMALDVLKSSTSFIVPLIDEYVKLRIGLHSGPCASGIVGKKTPRYCLFGDTVNTASCIESTGEACRIHMSPNTKALLDMYGGFRWQEQGSITVKGKGEMTTYWLIGVDADHEATRGEPPNLPPGALQ